MYFTQWQQFNGLLPTADALQDRFDLAAHAARMAELDSARQAEHRAAQAQAAAARSGNVVA